MAERKSQRLRRASRGRGEADEDRREEDAGGEGNAPQEEEDGNLPFEDSDKGVFGTLKDTAADAALAVLKPVAKRAATKAAQFAVEKGPELMEDTVMPKLKDAGGPMGLVAGLADGDGPAGALLSKFTGGDDEDGGGDAGDGTGKGRRMPVQQAVDVAAPIDIVYDQFTQFEDWPKFMHRVESVEQKDDATVVFNEKIWIIRRRWEAEIVEQRPDERIVWESVSGMQHVGVVTFHELAERLTRIELNIDIDPSGPMEKIARGARVAKRAARADLKRFKAYVEMHEDETGAWRGEIQDGEVVAEDGEYDERHEDEEYEDEPEAQYEDEEPEAEYEDEEPEEEQPEEPEAEYEEEEDEEPEEPEEEEQPRRRAKSRSSSSNGSSKSESAAPKRSRSSSRRGSSSSGGSSKSKSGSSRSRGSSKSRSSSSGSKSSSSGAKSSSSRRGSASSKSSSSKSSAKGNSKASSSRSRGTSKSGSSGSRSSGSRSSGKSRAKASSSKS